jgi:predicted dehydrogenase
LTKPVSVAVFGVGVFGSNHLRVYRELEEAGEPLRIAAIVDADPATPERIRHRYRAGGPAPQSTPPVYSSVEECLDARRTGRLHFDAASICVPTSAHYALASRALSEGLDVLLEKPIASTLEEADGLVRQANEADRILQIGHVERFNPAVSAVIPLLNGPMFFESHRLSVFTPRALDVDVVLDLMIHDLDVVLSFAGSPVSEVRATGLPILSPKVDIANVRLEFASGAVANFTASRVSTEQVRKLRFFQPHQYVSIDYARRDVLVINVAAAAGRAPDLSTAARAGLSFHKPAVTDGEPLQLEIRDFLDCVRSRRSPRVTAAAGRHALALALEINREIAAHAERAGLQRFSS